MLRPEAVYSAAAVISFPGLKQSPMRSLWYLTFVVALISTGSGFAQKLVDPNTVAPEYRAAAEKRRAEQIKLIECRKKADAARVLPRDRVDHLIRCMDADSEK
jgi:hypothetical protein